MLDYIGGFVSASALCWVLAAAVIILLFVTWRNRSKKSKLPKTSIPVVDVTGTIRYARSSKGCCTRIEEQLDKVAGDKPPAIIVRINSPGGTVGASDSLYSKLVNLRRDGIKVVALMEDVAASGGLYVAMGADNIVAHSGTITGSIGVIMQTVDASAILHKAELTFNTIRSGPFKDVGSFSRPMKEEERKLLQEMVDDTHETFCALIADSRKIPLEVVRQFADGRIMTGTRAAHFGLIDRLGGMDEALMCAERLAGMAARSATPRIFKEKRTVLERLGISTAAGSLFEGLRTEASLSGLPLLRMPKF